MFLIVWNLHDSNMSEKEYEHEKKVKTHKYKKKRVNTDKYKKESDENWTNKN